MLERAANTGPSVKQALTLEAQSEEVSRHYTVSLLDLEDSSAGHLTNWSLVLSWGQYERATAPMYQSAIVSCSNAADSLQLASWADLGQPQERCIGTVRFPMRELVQLPNGQKKHWITLFEDEADNLYDGDYQCDDTDLPRVLLSYELQPQPSAPLSPYRVSVLPIAVLPSPEISQEAQAITRRSGISQDSPRQKTQKEAETSFADSVRDSNVMLKSPEQPHTRAHCAKEAICTAERNANLLPAPLTESNLAAAYSEDSLRMLPQAVMSEYQSSTHSNEDNKATTFESSESLAKVVPSSVSDPNPTLVSASIPAKKDKAEEVKKTPNTAQGEKVDAYITGNRRRDKQGDRGPTEVEQPNARSMRPEMAPVAVQGLAQQLESGTLTKEVDRLTKENARLRCEVEKLEKEKTNVLMKLQREVQDNDAQISRHLKEKYELKQRVVFLENSLSSMRTLCSYSKAEATRERDLWQSTTNLKEQEAKLKCAQYQAQIQSLQELLADSQTHHSTSIAAPSESKCDHEYGGQISLLSDDYKGKLVIMYEQVTELEARLETTTTLLKEERRQKRECEEEKHTLQLENVTLRDELERWRRASFEEQTQREELQLQLAGHYKEASDKIVELTTQLLSLQTELAKQSILKESASNGQKNLIADTTQYEKEAKVQAQATERHLVQLEKQIAEYTKSMHRQADHDSLFFLLITL